MYAVAHLFYVSSNMDWYLIGYSMKDNKDYIFALTKGFEVEYGDVYLPEMLEVKCKGLSIERDICFEPIEASKLYKKLKEER